MFISKWRAGVMSIMPLSCLPAPLTSMLKRPLATVECSQHTQNHDMPNMQRTPYLSPYLHFLAKAAPDHTPNCASAWASTSCRQCWASPEQINRDSICGTAQREGLRASFQLGSAGTDKPTTANIRSEYALQTWSNTLGTYSHRSFKLSVATQIQIFVIHAV